MSAEIVMEGASRAVRTHLEATDVNVILASVVQQNVTVISKHDVQ